MIAGEEFQGTDRFEILRRLGAGGMGVVYEALDRQRDARLALKTLRGLGGEELLQFKREFRALQEVQHPNLISLGELFEHGGQFFFTMELVHGPEILSWVRGWSALGHRERSDDGAATTLVQPTALGSIPPARARGTVPPAPRLDEVRLRASLSQLAHALAALHAAGKIHRDVKPSNVLVNPDGRVVVLDLGLVADLARTSGHGARLAGTLPYMAPEVFGGAAGPEADWYAVGVMLYEMLTGALPFEGSPASMLLHKKTAPPPSPREVAARVPEDLDVLCLRLLDPDPTRRPIGRDILRHLDAARRPLTSLLPPPRGQSVFVGRAHELSALWSAFDEVAYGPVESRIVIVRGESGIGKTALVRRFVEEVCAKEDAVVLSGRCYEREAVRYKGVDAIVDALCQYLASLDEDALAQIMPRDAALLARVFPVLRRVPAFAVHGEIPHEGREPHELRDAVFVALRELLFTLAERAPLLLTIDDLQWADGDSVALLREVLRAGHAPRVTLVATSRAPVDLGDLPVVELSLGPLSELDGVTLARACVDHPDAVLDAASVVREAAGHPMFIAELARHHARGSVAGEGVRLDDVLRRRVEALPVQARALLEVLCVAGVPIAEATAGRAALDDPSEFHRWLAFLRGASLVKASGEHAADSVEARHDRIREAVVASMPSRRRGERARALVRAIEVSGERDPASLAPFYELAGEPLVAAEHAERAAESAMDAFAFERAAAFYRDAIRLRAGGAPAELHARLGDALALAGRGEGASRAYLLAARLSVDGHVLRRRASEALLRSGHIDEGLDVLAGVLSDVKLRFPATPAEALARAGVERARLRLRGTRTRLRSDAPTHELRRLDAAFAVVTCLSMVDVVRAAAFQACALRLALDAGEPTRLVRTLSMSACILSSDPSTRDAAREHFAQAASIARGLGDPLSDAWIDLARAVIAFHDGAFEGALAHADRALTLLSTQCRGVFWEMTSGRSVAFWALGYLGRLRELGRRVDELLREARARGDRYADVCVRTGASHLTRLAADDPAASRAESARAVREWSRRAFTTQHVFDLFTQAETLLYEDRAPEGLALVEARWTEVRRSQIVRAQPVRVFMLELRGRLELASAIDLRRGGRRRGGLLEACASRGVALTREGLPWASALAASLRAGIASASGDREGARAGFLAAAEAFDHAGMTLHAAAASVAAGVTSRDAAFTDEGVARPARFARMLAPS